MFMPSEPHSFGRSDSSTWSYPVKCDLLGNPVVIGIHDGDTVRLALDCGLEQAAFPWLRLRGANAPELSTGKPGTDARRWMLDQLSVAGTIEVVVHLRERSFARWVADINVDGTDLAEAMIAAGQAVPMKV